MTKRSLKQLITIFLPVIKPVLMLRNRISAKGNWVLVLGGRSYARELVQQLHRSKYKIYLFDAAPQSFNWRFASASCVLDVYDPDNIAHIVATAKRLGCKSALMQSDDQLLPIVAEVNKRLGSPASFSETAVGATLDKEIMRDRFSAAGMDLPTWRKSRVTEDLTDIPLPCIVKPLIGQGSKGVAYVTDIEGITKAKAFIQTEMGQDHVLIEEYLPGRQFNVDGVISNGVAYIHMIAEEEFADFVPLFKPCWYLFGIALPKKMRDEIVRETRAALAAVDFQSGAFHLELKFRGDRAYAFDMANRMPADFPKYEYLVHGVSLVEDYLKVMQGEPVAERDMAVKCAHLRYYNYGERPDHARIDALAQSLADAGKIKLQRDGVLLEMTADHEDILRDFLRDVHAFRDND